MAKKAKTDFSTIFDTISRLTDFTGALGSFDYSDLQHSDVNIKIWNTNKSIVTADRGILPLLNHNGFQHNVFTSSPCDPFRSVSKMYMLITSLMNTLKYPKVSKNKRIEISKILASKNTPRKRFDGSLLEPVKQAISGIQGDGAWCSWVGLALLDQGVIARRVEQSGLIMMLANPYHRYSLVYWLATDFAVCVHVADH